MLRALLPRCARARLTANANPRALPPATLASLAGQLGAPRRARRARPARARSRARASSPGAGGAVLATGSIYLVADLRQRAAAGAGRRRCERRAGPSVLAMIASSRSSSRS